LNIEDAQKGPQKAKTLTRKSKDFKFILFHLIVNLIGIHGILYENALQNIHYPFGCCCGYFYF